MNYPPEETMRCRSAQKEVQVIDQNLALLAKLESFTAATMEHLAERLMAFIDELRADSASLTPEGLSSATASPR